MSIFSINLRKLRKINGWSQQKSADNVGVKRPLFGAWEEGRSEPKRAQQLSIMRVFGIHNWDAFCDKEDFNIFNQPGAPLPAAHLTELQEKFTQAEPNTQEAIRLILGVKTKELPAEPVNG